MPDDKRIWVTVTTAKNNPRFLCTESTYAHCLLTQKMPLLFVFSAWGGTRTGSKLPLLTAYFPVLAYGIFGKGGLFVSPPLLTGLRALLPELEQVVPIYSSFTAQVADYQTLT